MEINKSYSGFELKSIKRINDLESNLYEFKHKQSEPQLRKHNCVLFACSRKQWFISQILLIAIAYKSLKKHSLYIYVGITSALLPVQNKRTTSNHVQRHMRETQTQNAFENENNSHRNSQTASSFVFPCAHWHLAE